MVEIHMIHGQILVFLSEVSVLGRESKKGAAATALSRQSPIKMMDWCEKHKNQTYFDKDNGVTFQHRCANMVNTTWVCVSFLTCKHFKLKKKTTDSVSKDLNTFCPMFLKDKPQKSSVGSAHDLVYKMYKLQSCFKSGLLSGGSCMA